MTISMKKVVEFDESEIKKLIQDKAAELMGNTVGQSSTIDLPHGDPDVKLHATVTFLNNAIASKPQK